MELKKLRAIAANAGNLGIEKENIFTPDNRNEYN